MNQSQQYVDVNQQHAPQPASSISQQYSYGQPQALQPASQPYQPNGYGYAYTSMAPMSASHPVTSSMGSHMMPQSLPLPAMSSSGQQPPTPGQPYPGHNPVDQTGQIAPHGMKPRVTATLWEDEGSLCFQVEANGVCVARREDNHMINGTKLLNVAGMTRGRRDGILKSEKTRHVVKIGPMHLKGVWIPFDRALDFANKEKITESLYPLFVHNIGALLYHPTNQARGSIGNAAMAARHGRGDSQSDYMRTPTGSQPPALTHHHSMSNPIGASVPQPPHSIAPHPASGRPGLDRAHTFPTPPASASSLMGMGNSGSSYEYGGQQSAAMHPVSTPPGSSAGPVQYPSTQSYDSSRQMYSAPSAYSQYGAAHQYAQVQPSPGIKNEMAPPARAGAENDHVESKPVDGYNGQQDAEGDHEGEYTHNSASTNDARRRSYSYNPNTTPGPVHSNQPHMQSDMAHSPQTNGSGRATPRTATTYNGYSTPQRATQLPSSNLYNVMSNDTRAGAQSGPETYPTQAYQPPPGHQYPSMNGLPSSNKRVREMDDNEDAYGRPISSPGSGPKRQRTDGLMGNMPMPQPQSVKAVR